MEQFLAVFDWYLDEVRAAAAAPPPAQSEEDPGL
jgi:hypothetical protein